MPEARGTNIRAQTAHSMSILTPSIPEQPCEGFYEADISSTLHSVRLHVAVRTVANAHGCHGSKLFGQIGRWIAGRPSLLGLGTWSTYLSWRSDPSVAEPDLGGVFTPTSFRIDQIKVLDELPGITSLIWQHRPESVGFVRASTSDPFENPIVQPNYLSDTVDCAAIVGGMRLSRRLLQSPSMQKYFQEETFPGASVENDAELLDVARSYGGTAFHATGTCKMGPAHDLTAVVDDQLRVRGVDTLRIVDASIMPTIPSANTTAATMMIAEKAADIIRGRPAPAAALLQS